MRCPQCQHENRESAKFCEACGSKLELVCSACGTVLRSGARFCDNCGTPLKEKETEKRRNGETGKRKTTSDPSTTLRTGLGLRTSDSSNPQPPSSYTPRHLAERILAEQAAMKVRGAPDGERKIITALFADLKGSTALIEGLDPEEARAIVDPVLALMMEAAHRYEGYVAQSLGDGIFALFGAPIAHEDHAQRALYAALRMQEEMKRYADKLRLEKGVSLPMRVGVNTGEVVVRSIHTDDLHTDYVPVGHSTNLAARMENLATPGSIVISEHTYKLIEGYFECKALGAAQIKGVSEPVHIYEVMGVGPLRTRLQVAAKRGLARFVGRQSELAQLRQALERVREGRGQVVSVMGEPGVGKSRLCHEFKLLSQNGCLVLETFSVAYGKAYPYLPLIDLLKQYFHITPQDDERRKQEKVTGRVLTLDRTLEDTLPYLFSLLSVGESTLQQMDAQIRNRRTLEAVKRLLLRESLNQPVLLICEDLQWLDTETQAFFDLLGEGVASARILILGNYRPEYQHNWGNKTYYTQIRLDPLGRAEAEEMLSALLGDGWGVEPLRQFLLEKTEGNPFFMEEIVQALIDQRILVRGGGAGQAPLPVPLLTKPLTDIRLPPTVQGILAARIDRLGAEEKGLLHTLAVVGKEFSFSLLTKVADRPEAELQRLLSHLQAGEFLYEQPAFPEPSYTFKHTLTQEVAYSSVLVGQRKVLHQRTAQVIEELWAGKLEEQYSELAYHYSRSGNAAKAIEYLQLAGGQAVQRSAYAEAVGHFTTALEVLQTMPSTSERNWQELSLLVALGASLSTTKGYGVPEVESVYTRAWELSQRVEETPRLLSILMGLWRFYAARGEYQRARALAEQFTRLAQNVHDPSFLLPVHYTLGFTLFRLGEFAAARERFEQGIALYDPQQRRLDRSDSLFHGQNPGLGCLSWLFWALWYLGYPDQALKRIEEAHELVRELGRPASEAFIRYFAATVHRLRREGPVVREYVESVITLSNEHGLSYWLASGTFLRGWALAEQGQKEEGIAQMLRGLEAWRALGIEQLGQPSVILAEVCGQVGQVEEGLRLLDTALTQLQASGERWWEAELWRVKGELVLRFTRGHEVPALQHCAG